MEDDDDENDCKVNLAENPDDVPPRISPNVHFEVNCFLSKTVSVHFSSGKAFL